MNEVSESKKATLLDSLSFGVRLDGRGLLNTRDLNVLFGDSNGDIEVSLGCTRVFTRVVSEIQAPNERRPREGFLNFNINLDILNQNEQGTKAEDPRKNALEVSKILERIIKGAKVIDVESLCIAKGLHVWNIKVESTLLNNDGNFMDAIYISVILGLLTFRKPAVSYDSANGLKVYSKTEKAEQPLGIYHVPYLVSFAFINDSNIMVCDPLKEEEAIMDGKIMIAMNVYKEICLIHKPGGGHVSVDIIYGIMDIISIRVKGLIENLRSILLRKNEFGFDSIDWDFCLPLSEIETITKDSMLVENPQQNILPMILQFYKRVGKDGI